MIAAPLQFPPLLAVSPLLPALAPAILAATASSSSTPSEICCCSSLPHSSVTVACHPRLWPLSSIHFNAHLSPATPSRAASVSRCHSPLALFSTPAVAASRCRSRFQPVVFTAALFLHCCRPPPFEALTVVPLPCCSPPVGRSSRRRCCSRFQPRPLLLHLLTATFTIATVVPPCHRYRSNRCISLLPSLPLPAATSSCYHCCPRISN
ncbi:hypothetical protein B296_00040820 [Ensete ventricosum]|uniref:Uncharacterized protein n=1 Tax=Ensete ventricosum TaxID=4639 RepID=A0A426XYK8_ENSVE|nr:hypothetical protein B296_00040820 [Ensete ventricosum]